MPTTSFLQKLHVGLIQREGCSRLTCLVLGVARELDNQCLVVLLGVRELRLHFPFVVISKHL